MKFLRVDLVTYNNLIEKVKKEMNKSSPTERDVTLLIKNFSEQ